MARERPGSLDPALDEYRAQAEHTRRARARDWAGLTPAIAAASVMASSADAAVVYSGIQNVDTNPLSGGYTYFGSTGIDLDLDGDPDFRIGVSLDFESGVGGGWLERAGLGVGVAAGPSASAARFASGATIGSSQSFIRNGALFFQDYIQGTYLGPLATGSTGFFGVRLDGSFGWIRIRMSDEGSSWPAGDTLTAIDWAYETTPGQSIQAGQIPEPATGSLVGLGLLALGAAGVRRRRQTLED